jgi:hypothetical protein
VRYICSTRLQGFSYMLLGMKRYKGLVARGLVLAHAYLNWPLQQQNVLREAVEAYIRKNIEEGG